MGGDEGRRNENTSTRGTVSETDRRTDRQMGVRLLLVSNFHFILILILFATCAV